MVAMFFLRFSLFRARSIAASMAIDGPEATAGAPPIGGQTAQERLSCPARNDGICRQGKNVVTALLRPSGRGAAVLRPDQAITEVVWSGTGMGARTETAAILKEL
jgi:hypothetical protein